MSETIPVLPAWVADCATCSTGVATLCETNDIVVMWTLARHISADHPALLPDYVDGCPNCEEWLHCSNLGWPTYPAGVAAELDRTAAEHRAAHLILDEIPLAPSGMPAGR